MFKSCSEILIYNFSNGSTPSEYLKLNSLLTVNPTSFTKKTIGVLDFKL